MDNKPGILSMQLCNNVVISPEVCQYHYLVIRVYWLMEKRNSQLHNRSLSSNPGHDGVKAYTRGKFCVPQHTGSKITRRTYQIDEMKESWHGLVFGGKLECAENVTSMLQIMYLMVLGTIVGSTQTRQGTSLLNLLVNYQIVFCYKH